MLTFENLWDSGGNPHATSTVWSLATEVLVVCWKSSTPFARQQHRVTPSDMEIGGYIEKWHLAISYDISHELHCIQYISIRLKIWHWIFRWYVKFVIRMRTHPDRSKTNLPFSWFHRVDRTRPTTPQAQEMRLKWQKKVLGEKSCGANMGAKWMIWVKKLQVWITKIIFCTWDVCFFSILFPTFPPEKSSVQCRKTSPFLPRKEQKSSRLVTKHQ